MSENEKKSKELDDFWDISSLTASSKPLRSTGRDTSAFTVTDGYGKIDNSQNKLTSPTVIERFIPPHYKNELVPAQKECFSYIPESSLIHKVTVYRDESSYDFYSDFVSDAKRLWNIHGQKCEYADFFSYSPQYNQLSKPQLNYYLWWRENLRNGIFIKTNLYYTYLYMFELINASSDENAPVSRDSMVSVAVNYSDMLKGVMPKLLRWICDFSLLHRLPPPKNFSERLFSVASTLREYFVNIVGDTPEGWARVLLSYCCSYDYRTSKFATDDNITLFDTHVFGAIASVVKGLSANGKILSSVPFGDCSITSKAYEGALCSSQNRFTIVAEYCSFSRSHELRFLIGDAVKYAENKIRTHIGVKSRLTVYSLPNELREVIDEYFAVQLPHRRTDRKIEQRQEYEALYDLPKAGLNISNAKYIENASWKTTKELVEAFDTDTLAEPIIEEVSPKFESTENGFLEYAEVLSSLLTGNGIALRELAQKQGKPIEALVDEINELSVELIGDIIIEEENGIYRIIEDYEDYIKEIT